MNQRTHILITAGPTFEPIDRVRYIGNRSSGKMGIHLAQAAAEAGHRVTLLLGPVPNAPQDARIDLHRFRTCADLGSLLETHASSADVLMMAAAVADYTPVPLAAISDGKFRRASSAERVVLELVPTPDLLARTAAGRRANQLFIGFALEPRHEVISCARAKLERKRIDLVVANPLETMESDGIEAAIVRAGSVVEPPEKVMTKQAFATWFIEQLQDDIQQVCHQPAGVASKTGTHDQHSHELSNQ